MSVKSSKLRSAATVPAAELATSRMLAGGGAIRSAVTISRSCRWMRYSSVATTATQKAARWARS